MNTGMLFGRLKPVDAQFTAFRNRSATAFLPGQPVCYVLDGTNDGVDAQKSSEAGVNKCKANFVGVCTQPTPVGQYGIAQSWGINKFVRCSGSLAANRVLIVNSGTDNFGDGGTTATYDAVATIGPGTLPFAVSAQATTTVQGVANVSPCVFLRCM